MGFNYLKARATLGKQFRENGGKAYPFFVSHTHLKASLPLQYGSSFQGT